MHSIVIQSECEQVWPPIEPVLEVGRGGDGNISLTIATYEESSTDGVRLKDGRFINVQWADLEAAYLLVKARGV